MKIMVVGGGGYLGSMLVKALLADGHEIALVDLFWFSCPPAHNRFHDRLAVRKMNAAALAIEDMRGLDAVVFLAGLSNDPMADFDPLANFHANAAIPAYLANIAAKAGVERFIHGSSCSVYGHVTRTVDESESPKTTSPYGISKLMAEKGINASEVQTVINLRMGTISGYSTRMRYDLMVNAMVKDAVLSNVINVNDPAAKRPYLHIADAVDAYRAALAWKPLHSQDKHRLTVNVFSGNTTIDVAATTICAEIKYFLHKDVPIVSRNILDKRSYVVGSMFWKKLGFKPRHEQIGNIVEDVISNLDKTPDLNGDAYYNIRVFEKLRADSSLTPAP